MVAFDEPFTRLLTQGMVVNHTHFRRNDRGGIGCFPPSEVMPVADAGAPAALREGMSILLRARHPVVPNVAWNLWRDLGYAAEAGDLLDVRWPEVDPAALVPDEIELVRQINGRMRGKLAVAAGADQAAIEAAAVASREVKKHAAVGAMRKVVVVPERLVNGVV